MPTEPPINNTLPASALFASADRCNLLAKANASSGIGMVFKDRITLNQPIAFVSVNCPVYAESEQW
jgi:hypothetical protein